MASRKKNTVDHRKRKDGGSAEFHRKRREARNAARPKQRWVPSTVDGNPIPEDATLEEIDTLITESSVYIPAHWERP